MNNDIDTRLDQALELLLDGASLSSLCATYPDLADELLQYEKILTQAASLRSARPSEQGLRKALSAYVEVEQKTNVMRAQPSPYLTFFALYRGVLVLPVLLVVLLGAGVWRAYPALAPTSASPSPEVLNTGPQNQNAADTGSTNVPSPAVPASSRMMLMKMPEDTATTTPATDATSTASTSHSVGH